MCNLLHIGRSLLAGSRRSLRAVEPQVRAPQKREARVPAVDDLGFPL
jgi:hypothetical protein